MPRWIGFANQLVRRRPEPAVSCPATKSGLPTHRRSDAVPVRMSSFALPVTSCSYRDATSAPRRVARIVLLRSNSPSERGHTVGPEGDRVNGNCGIRASLLRDRNGPRRLASRRTRVDNCTASAAAAPRHRPPTARTPRR